MKRFLLLLLVVLAPIGMVAASAAGGSPSGAPAQSDKNCPPGYVDATLSWGEKCLHSGQFCKVGNPEYHAYGFDCPADGHLVDYVSAPTTTAATTTTPSATTSTVKATPTPPTVAIGHTILLHPRSQTRGCTRGALPDRQCSPGAYYSGLTKAVLCSPTFRTGTIRNVPDSEKHQVEIEYGMAPKAYGRTIEIDHIVSLELGGSNDIANLYPEPGSGKANYHVKDKLENRLHKLVCSGSMTLHAAQVGIARNWETLYKTVFSVAP